ncbi:MAG: hypothetical protein U0525_05390 [Patescibacteria group bacterium]
MEHKQEFEFAKDLALQAGKIMIKYFNSDEMDLEDEIQYHSANTR